MYLWSPSLVHGCIMNRRGMYYRAKLLLHYLYNVYTRQLLVYDSFALPRDPIGFKFLSYLIFVSMTVTVEGNDTVSTGRVAAVS